MKKKILVFFLAIGFALAGFLPCFSCYIFDNKMHKFAGSLDTSNQYSGIESEYSDETTRELIPANILVNLSNAKVEKGLTPYNLETKARYEGEIITPNAGEYGEFKNFNIGIKSYRPNEDDEIFLWVYLLDTGAFTLRISISDGVDTLMWNFSHQRVSSMGDGWKLLQLNMRDCENASDNEALQEDLMSKVYSTLILTYCSEAEFEDPNDSDLEDAENGDYYTGIETKTSERFSFYHVFVSDNIASENETGLIYNLPKTYYEYSDKFGFDGTIYIGDKIQLKSAKDIFKVLYIGKLDLSNYVTESKYYWEISFDAPSTGTARIEFGDYINFYEEGFYHLSIQLLDEWGSVILNDDISIFCEELTLGKFLMGSQYKVNNDKKLVISFVLADGITIEDDYSIIINNNNAQIYSKYQENNTIYICIEGVNAGVSSLEISAKAKSVNGEKSQKISETASITVEQEEEGFGFVRMILLIVLLCLITGFVIYMSISLVKSRKNDVK